jgi:hypothetical protein
MGTKLRLLHVLALGRELGLPWRWLLAEANAGRIPCLRVGKALRFEPRAVELALAARAAKGEASHAS